MKIATYCILLLLAISINMINSETTGVDCPATINGLPSPCSIVNQINSARTKPSTWANIISNKYASLGTRDEITEVVNYLKSVVPVNPVELNTCLSVASQRQANYLKKGWGTNPHFGCNQDQPWDRISGVGTWTSVGENIAGGMADPEKIVAAWLIDSGVLGRGHRLNLMSAKYTSAGVGSSSNTVQMYNPTVVADFANSFKAKSPCPSVPLIDVQLICGLQNQRRS